MLRTLSGFSIRRPGVVVAGWLIILAVGFSIGTMVFGRTVGDVGTVPGTDSAKVNTLLSRLQPNKTDIAAYVPGSPTDGNLRQSVENTVAAVRAIPNVSHVSDPYTTPGLIADDRQALLIPVDFPGGLTDHQQHVAVDAARDALLKIDAPHVQVGGGPLLDDELNGQALKDVSKAEELSLPIVLILLLFVFGGLLAASLPLVIAVTGIGSTFLVLDALSYVTDVSVYAIQVTTMLGLGLAIDYSLLMVTRFRKELNRRSPLEAAEIAAKTAGRTVFFSGLTVAVALAGLLVFPDPFLRSMGMAGAAVVAIDMLAAVTLLPALLGKFGHRIKPSPESARSGRFFSRVARVVQRRPVALLLLIGVGIGVLAVPASSMRLSTGDARSLSQGVNARDMYDNVATHFGTAVMSDPIDVVSQSTDPAAIASVTRFVSGLPDVADVAPSTPGGPGSGVTLLTVHVRGVADDAAAQAVVRDIRNGPYPVSVGGRAARLVDYRHMLAQRLPIALGAIVLVTLILLFAFTGSVLIPLKAVLTNLLSIGAALGVMVWMFQDGHLASVIGADKLGAIDLSAPVLVAAIAFGLSMDYEVFLLSSMRERWLSTNDDRDAVAAGLRFTGRVVTSAALLLIVVFLCFMTGAFSPIKQIGLGLSTAVFLDATLVRMVLVPAAMTLLGRAAWWSPQALRRAHARVALAE